MEDQPINQTQWNDADTQIFLDFGKYFVPDREHQIEIICDLLPPHVEPFHILELGCGEGLLAEAILSQSPHSVVHGYDGSALMLQRAATRLSRFGKRFQAALFDLKDPSWRKMDWPVHAVVSSLLIHHLDGEEKLALFQDIFRLLPETEGVVILADIILPADGRGMELAAQEWEKAVRQRSLEIDGNIEAFKKFQHNQWNTFRYPDDPIDKPSRLFDQLMWLEEAGFVDADVYWLKAGHAVFGARKTASSK